MANGIIALYIRLSLEDEKYDSMSIENQHNLLRVKAMSLPEYASCEIKEFILDLRLLGLGFQKSFRGVIPTGKC